MEETVKQRLIKFIQYLGISTRSFEGNCNLSFGYVANLKSSPSADKIMSILNAYPSLSQAWLMTGEGEMLRHETISVTTEDVSGDSNSVGSPIHQNIGEVSGGQNAGRDINNTTTDSEKWFDELEAQRKLTEKAQSIAETTQAQLSTALEQITTLIRQNNEQFNQFMVLLQNLKTV